MSGTGGKSKTGAPSMVVCLLLLGVVDVSLRDHYPLGDQAWRGPLLSAN